jgi:hypothetical protein
MPLTFLLALQAAAAPAPPLLELDFDLARYSPAEFGLDGGCNHADPSAIVVCARGPGGAYPLAQMARIFEPHRHVVAETHLTGNLTGNVRVERNDMAADRGVVPNRIMVGLRLPF